MGWCLGTGVFDAVAKSVIGFRESNLISEAAVYGILGDLVEALQDQDWDCETDTSFLEHPLVRLVYIGKGIIEQDPVGDVVGGKPNA